MDERDYLWEGFPQRFRNPYVMPPLNFDPTPPVIVPTVGAAKYWYVDPKAGGVPSPTSAPTVNLRQSFYNPTTTPPAGSSGDLVNRTPGTNYSQPGASIRMPQERADIYDKMRYQGMTEPANVDHELAQGTGIFEIDGVHYVLPTKIEGTDLTPDEIFGRFKATGEHLGGFSNPKDARNYERNYLQSKPPNLLLRKVLGKAPRLADDRKDLLKDTDDTFYGGGQAPPPTPTPTPTKVKKGVSYAS